MGKTVAKSPFGAVQVTVESGQVVELVFHDGPESADPEDASLVELVLRTLGGEDVPEDVPVLITATDFQRRVWEELMRVPRGSTATYSEIARKIGLPHAQRAVANACGANRLAVLVPCHRAVRSDGELGGYRWGEDIKRRILLAEGAL